MLAYAEVGDSKNILHMMFPAKVGGSCVTKSRIEGANVQVRTRGGSLVSKVGDALRGRILAGEFQTGARLPTETQLTQEFAVSRTVIREAIAALRADGLVEARQGAGVFVLDAQTTGLALSHVDPRRLSSVVESLELRTAIEGDAAAFAAQRRSPAQEEAMVEALHAFAEQVRIGGATAEADFRLHLSIADASNNPRFSEYLRLMGANAIPRRAVGSAGEAAPELAYLELLLKEHEAIVSSILAGDEAAARDSMRAHLRNSQSRYRSLLLESRSRQGDVQPI